MENSTPLSRVEDILQSTIDSTEYDKPPQSRVEKLLIDLKEVIEDGGDTSAYHPAGSVDSVAELPAPSADYLGYVYDITQAFTTTSDFKEGAGKSYPAGSNIAIVDIGTPESPSYKYDILSGFIDTSNFVEKEEGKGLSTNDYTDAEKTKLGGIAEGAEVNVQSDWNESDNSSDAYIQNKPTLGTASALNVAESGNAGDNEVVKGNDSRLTDDRNPTPHTHTTSQITDFPTLGTAAGLNVPTTGDASSSEVVKGNDSRVVNSPIVSTTTGINPSIADSADSMAHGLTVYGRSAVSKNLFGGVYGEIYDFANVIPASTSVAISFIRTAGDAGGAVTVNFYEKNSDTRYDYFTISGSNRAVTLGNDTGRVSFTGANAEIANIQLELGSEPTPYEPYFSGIHGIGEDGEVDVVTCGKNLIPSWASGYIKTGDGKTVEPNLYWTYTPNYIVLDNDHDYVISADITNSAALYYYDANKNFISVSTQIMTSSKQYVIRNVPTRPKYIRIGFNVSGASVPITSESMPIYKVQLELGSTATAYEPYVSSTATLTSGLPLCGIPVNSGETYTDEQGQKWLADTESVDGIVKRCGVVDLGDYEWTYDSQYPQYNRFYTNLSDVTDVGMRVTPMVCATYIVISDGRPVQNIPDKSIYVISTNLYVHDSAYTDPTTFKSAVTGVKLVYPLATPTTQELTPTEKSALLNLKTFDSTTNVTVTDSPTVDVGYLLNTDNGQAVANIQNELQEQINEKVDKVEGKGLSTNDYDNNEKARVAAAAAIDDTTASSTTTYSSNKINTLNAGKEKKGIKISYTDYLALADKDPDVNYYVPDAPAETYEIYTFKIDHDDDNPATCVKPFIHGYGCDNYDYQNAGMDYSNDVFKYGDWANAFFIKNLKPCYLNADGTIEYELDKNDYKKKADGTNASEVTDLASTGNVMVGFPTVWIYRYMSVNTEYVVISNKQLDYRFKAWAHHDKNGKVLLYIYLAAYNGSLSDYDSAVGVSTGKLRSISGVDYHNLNAITNNKILSNTTRDEEINFAQRNNVAGEQGEGWYIRHKAEWDMVNDLLVLISRTTDTQTAFGNGVISGYVSATNTGIKATGLYDDKGLFYGKNTQTDPVKVFGIENWWGNIWNSLAGWIMVNGTQKVKMTHGTEDGSTVTGFNTDGTGYVAIPNSTPSGTSGGYISGWRKSEYGMIPLVASGTSGTYLCDGLWFNNSGTLFALVGGSSAGSWRYGAFCSHLADWAGGRSWDVGAALSYKPHAA